MTHSDRPWIQAFPTNVNKTFRLGTIKTEIDKVQPSSRLLQRAYACERRNIYNVGCYIRNLYKVS